MSIENASPGWMSGGLCPWRRPSTDRMDLDLKIALRTARNQGSGDPKNWGQPGTYFVENPPGSRKLKTDTSLYGK